MARSCTYTPAWQFHQPSTHGGTRCSSPCTRSAHYLPPFAYRGARCSLPSHNHLRAALASPIPPSALPPRTLSSAIQAARIPAPAAFAAPSLRTSRSPQARSPPGPAAGRGGPALPRSVPPRSAPPRPAARRQAGKNAFNGSQPVHQRQQILALPAALRARLRHLQVSQDSLQLRSPRRLLRRDTGSDRRRVKLFRERRRSG